VKRAAKGLKELVNKSKLFTWLFYKAQSIALKILTAQTQFLLTF
jgi:hypothetical protein